MKPSPGQHYRQSGPSDHAEMALHLPGVRTRVEVQFRVLVITVVCSVC